MPSAEIQSLSFASFMTSYLFQRLPGRKIEEVAICWLVSQIPHGQAGLGLLVCIFMHSVFCVAL